MSFDDIPEDAARLIYARVTVACFMAGAPMPPKGAAFAYKMILLTIRMRGWKL